MDDKSLPSQERLFQLFRFNFRTGRVYWRERPASDFVSRKACAIWNARFSNEEAFITVDGQGYYHGRIGNNRPKAHSVIWCAAYGTWPKQIDHINGDRLDNRLANLREVTSQQNNRNRRIPLTNTSGVIGVVKRRDSGRWRAYINNGGRREWIGSYDKFDDAVAARRKAERDYGYHPNHGRP